MSILASIVWRRLDLPGHEAAQLVEHPDGWTLDGVAVFTHATRACRLEYVVACDRGWKTQRCDVTGFVGTRPVAIAITVDQSRRWSVDGAPNERLDGCVDVDLAFSPVTNLLPIRRLALATGASARVRAAWLRFPELELDVLEQVYTRLGRDKYRYESGNGVFQRELTVDASGLVLSYPDLWRAEP